MSDVSSQTNNHLTYIDGLRALAVLAVIFYHMHFSFVAGGFAGVDVFFVISGFVVTRSLLNSQQLSLLEYLAQFYSRRMVRILPALVTVLIATFVVFTLLIPASWLSDANTATGLAAFLGISNIALGSQGDHYFAPRPDFNPFVHTWSLGVEEQFYVLFPFLLYAYTRLEKKNKWIAFAVILLFPALMSIALAKWGTKAHPLFSFYSISTRFWELALGSFINFLPLGTTPLKNNSNKKIFWLQILSAASLFLILKSFWYSKPTSFPMSGALMPCFATMALIYLCAQLPSSSFIPRVLSQKHVAYIGLISYSLYLWHWPFIVIARWTVGADGAIKKSVLLLLILFFAMISYHFLESPLRNKFRSDKVKKQTLIIIVSVLVVAASFLAAKTIDNDKFSLSLHTVMRNRTAWYPDYSHVLSAIDVLYPNRQKLCRGKEEVINQASYAITKYSVADCSRRVNHSIFAYGDSHTAAIKGILRVIAEDAGMDIHFVSASDCPYLELIRDDKVACAAKAQFFPKYLETYSRPGDIVIASSLRLPRFSDQWTQFESKEKFINKKLAAIPQPSDAYNGAVKKLEAIKIFDLRVVITSPTPQFFSAAFRCVGAFNEYNPDCRDGLSIPRDKLLEYRQPMMDSLTKLSHTIPNVYLYDAFSALCPTETCSALNHKDEPLFFDGDHLSSIGNTTIYKGLKEALLGHPN